MNKDLCNQERDKAVRTGSPEADGDLALAEETLSALSEVWDTAADELGSTVPPAQLRAVLAIGAIAPVTMTALAKRLRASVSAASRLCDRLQQAGLITRDADAAPDRRGVLVSLTAAGANVAARVREQRRGSLATILADMTPAARRALTDSLRELAAAAGRQPDPVIRERFGQAAFRPGVEPSAMAVDTPRKPAAGDGLQPAQAGSWWPERLQSPARMDEAVLNMWAHDPAGVFASIDGSAGRSLCALTQALADHVPSCCGASATLWEPDVVMAMGASNADLAAVAEHQFLAGDGPIIAALRTGEPAVTTDTLREDRWPEFAVAALAAGVRSQATLVHDYSLMTLSLSVYGTEPGAFDEDKLSPAALFARFDMAEMAGAAEVGRVQRTAQQLDAAIQSRAEVEQARELVMQKLHCGPDQAFERLWRTGQQQQRKVAEVAHRMVTAGEVVEGPVAST